MRSGCFCCSTSGGNARPRTYDAPAITPYAAGSLTPQRNELRCGVKLCDDLCVRIFCIWSWLDCPRWRRVLAGLLIALGVLGGLLNDALRVMAWRVHRVEL